MLFAAVNVARKLQGRSRSSRCAPPPSASAAACEARGRASPHATGADWDDLGPDAQLGYYARARLNEET